MPAGIGLHPGGGRRRGRPGEEVVLLLWAHATLRIAAPALCGAAAQWAEASAPRLTPQGACLFAWAFARLWVRSDSALDAVALRTGRPRAGALRCWFGREGGPLGGASIPLLVLLDEFRWKNDPHFFRSQEAFLTALHLHLHLWHLYVVTAVKLDPSLIPA